MSLPFHDTMFLSKTQVKEWRCSHETDQKPPLDPQHRHRPPPRRDRFFIYLHAAAHTDLSLTLAITFATTTYHFAIRLLTGFVFQHTMKNRADLTRSWYQLRPFEQKLYRTLRVKTWKNKLPTYYPDLFDPSLHTLPEIAGAMCQAELVHEVIIPLSLLPILASHWFHAFPVFLLTSLAASLFDLLLVITQRYNRDRILRILNHKKSK
ncbi:MAG: hypothetical protein ACLTNN_06355 [Blautia sp.]